MPIVRDADETTVRGAEVLNLRSPNLPGNHAHDVESTRGKM